MARELQSRDNKFEELSQGEAIGFSEQPVFLYEVARGSGGM